ncbi:MAG: ATP-binding protein [Raoultibacter sp.]
MKREALQELAQWAQAASHKPLVVYGARQVGKTYLLKEWGKRHFKNVAYLSFMGNRAAEHLFEADFDLKRIISDLQVLCNTRIIPGETLVILDEIQEAKNALSALKYFCEEAPDLHVVAAGSYLGIALHRGESFPVGKVDSITLHPMNYTEFLDAAGEEELADRVRALNFASMVRFRDKLERRLRQYFFVGGMPEAVAHFFSGGEDYRQARSVQQKLLSDYDKDFSKHPEQREIERVRLAFNSIPVHLGAENHKLVFGHIKPGSRAKDFETAIQWIVDTGLATRVYRVDKPGMPLSFYRDLSAFKLYLLDIGLLGALMHITPDSVLFSDNALTEYKGAMTEQYVCQQLVAHGCEPFYWSRKNSSGEIDFLVHKCSAVVPLEVKAAENVKARSLKLLCETYNLHGVRTSMKDYCEQTWMTNVPLWAVGDYFAQGQQW